MNDNSMNINLPKYIIIELNKLQELNGKSSQANIKQILKEYFKITD